MRAPANFVAAALPCGAGFSPMPFVLRKQPILWGGQSWPQPPFRRPDRLESRSAGRIACPTVRSNLVVRKKRVASGFSPSGRAQLASPPTPPQCGFPSSVADAGAVRPTIVTPAVISSIPVHRATDTVSPSSNRAANAVTTYPIAVTGIT